MTPSELADWIDARMSLSPRGYDRDQFELAAQELRRLEGESQIKNDTILSQQVRIETLTEAAQILHDLASFAHIHRKYDKVQLLKARKALAQEADNEQGE